MGLQHSKRVIVPAALAGIVFALQGCASNPPPPVATPYAPPPPYVYPPPPPPPMPRDNRAEEAALYAQMQRDMEAMQRAETDKGALAAYQQAKAEWAKAQQRIKDARSGKIAFAQPESAAGGVKSDKVPCPQIGGLATPSECASYAGLLFTMQNGIAAFDPPRAMDMGRQYPVKLVIGAEQVKAQVIDSATDAGDVKTVDLKLGSWICAELMAAQFKLQGPARQCKERGLSQQMSFDWIVSPRQDGKLKLGVKVESLAEQNGKPLDTIDSRMIAVDVQADAIGRFDMLISRLTDSVGGLRNFLLALASALGVLSVVVWRIRTLGQKPDKDALKDLTKS